jgi:hypothetical protein
VASEFKLEIHDIRILVERCPTAPDFWLQGARSSKAGFWAFLGTFLGVICEWPARLLLKLKFSLACVLQRFSLFLEVDLPRLAKSPR